MDKMEEKLGEIEIGGPEKPMDSKTSVALVKDQDIENQEPDPLVDQHDCRMKRSIYDTIVFYIFCALCLHFNYRFLFPENTDKPASASTYVALRDPELQNMYPLFLYFILGFLGSISTSVMLRIFEQSGSLWKFSFTDEWEEEIGGYKLNKIFKIYAFGIYCTLLFKIYFCFIKSEDVYEIFFSIGTSSFFVVLAGACIVLLNYSGPPVEPCKCQLKMRWVFYEVCYITFGILVSFIVFSSLFLIPIVFKDLDSQLSHFKHLIASIVPTVTVIIPDFGLSGVNFSADIFLSLIVPILYGFCSRAEWLLKEPQKLITEQTVWEKIKSEALTFEHIYVSIIILCSESYVIYSGANMTLRFIAFKAIVSVVVWIHFLYVWDTRKRRPEAFSDVFGFWKVLIRSVSGVVFLFAFFDCLNAMVLEAIVENEGNSSDSEEVSCRSVDYLDKCMFVNYVATFILVYVYEFGRRSRFFKLRHEHCNTVLGFEKQYVYVY